MKKLILLILLPIIVLSCTSSLNEQKSNLTEMIKKDTIISNSQKGILTSKIKDCKNKTELDAIVDKYTDFIVKNQLSKNDNQNSESIIPTWEYDKSKNQMTDQTSYFASLQSNNYVNLDFPYKGNTYAHLKLQNINGHNSIYVYVDRGQFGTSSESWIVRFNNEKPIRFNISYSNSRETGLRFINSGDLFLKKLKESDSIKIKMTFYDFGSFVYQFDTKNLKWNH